MKSFNWRYALGELALIFLAVTLAFLFDNWKENLNNRQIEIISLRQMSSNLTGDINDLNSNIRAARNTQNSLSLLLAQMDKKLPYHDSLDYHFGKVGLYTNFLNNISAYEHLKSIGFNYITNDSLRYEIIYYYDRLTKYLHAVEKEFINTNENNIIKPFYMKNFYYNSPLRPARPLNYSKLLSDHEFRNILTSTGVLLGFNIRLSERCKAKAEELNKFIQEEIRLLE